MYLWHWPIWLVTTEVSEFAPWFSAVLVGAVAVAAAFASYRLVERPVRTTPVLDVRPRLAIAGGLTLGPAAVLVASAVLAGSQPSLLRVGRFDTDEVAVMSDSEREALGSSPRGVDWAAVVDDEWRDADDLPMCTPTDPAGCLRHRATSATAPTVLLVGDSYAYSMLAYLDDYARRHDVTLYAAVALGCPWADLGLWPVAAAGPPTACGLMRSGWSTEMTAALAPDVVLLVNADVLLVPDQTRDLTGTVVGRMITGTVRNAVASGARVAIVENPPAFPRDPVACLADADDVAECTILDRSDEGTTTRLLRALAEGRPSITTVDLDDVVCRAHPLCPPYAGDRFVFSDREHVLPSWWMARRAELDERLAAVLDPDGTSGADAGG